MRHRKHNTSISGQLDLWRVFLKGPAVIRHRINGHAAGDLLDDASCPGRGCINLSFVRFRDHRQVNLLLRCFRCLGTRRRGKANHNADTTKSKAKRREELAMAATEVQAMTTENK